MDAYVSIKEIVNYKKFVAEYDCKTNSYILDLKSTVGCTLNDFKIQNLGIKLFSDSDLYITTSDNTVKNNFIKIKFKEGDINEKE